MELSEYQREANLIEVRVRTAREWEQAILRSFGVWRELRDHAGGTLHLDLEARTIDFEPPAAA